MNNLIERVVLRGASFSSRRLMGVLQNLQPAEREFRKVWPSINEVEGLLVSPMQERWLFKTAKSLSGGSTIVEIGSYKGRSTCCLAYGCRGTDKHVFAIDTFDGNKKDFLETAFFPAFSHNINHRGLGKYVTPVQGVSSEVGKRWNKPIHLLYIDGGHEYEDVLQDFETFYPFVVPGGIVAFHDVHNFESDHGPVGFPGVLKVWQEVAMPLLSEHGTCFTLAFGKKVENNATLSI